MENNLGIKGLDVKTIISALQDALAEEFNAWYAYIIAAPFLTGNNHLEVESAYKEFAKDELEDHAYWLMDRINKLGGKPLAVLSPDMINRKATHKYIVPDTQFDVVKSIEENIRAEKGAIETYTKLEALTRDKDIVTNTKIKEILADEQDHLQDLIELRDSCCGGSKVKSSKNGSSLNYLNLFKQYATSTKL